MAVPMKSSFATPPSSVSPQHTFKLSDACSFIFTKWISVSAYDHKHILTYRPRGQQLTESCRFDSIDGSTHAKFMCHPHHQQLRSTCCVHASRLMHVLANSQWISSAAFLCTKTCVSAHDHKLMLTYWPHRQHMKCMCTHPFASNCTS